MLTKFLNIAHKTVVLSLVAMSAAGAYVTVDGTVFMIRKRMQMNAEAELAAKNFKIEVETSPEDEKN